MPYLNDKAHQLVVDHINENQYQEVKTSDTTKPEDATKPEPSEEPKK